MTKQHAIEGAHITDKAKFYGYIMVSVLGLRWSIKSTIGAMLNQEMNAIVREYLVHTCGEDEWLKRQVLDMTRDQTRNSLRPEIKQTFPSLFHKRRMKPLQVPAELAEQDVVFDMDYINLLRSQVTLIKRGINMNENAIAETGEARPSEVQATTESAPVTVNFFLPAGVDAAELNLDNYRERTGKRFRMTKEQKSRGITRAEAFEESRTLAVNLSNGAQS